MADETTPEPATATATVTETPTKTMKPRKTPVKREETAVESGENGKVAAGDGETETPTKVKKPRETPVKKVNVKPKESEDVDAEEPTTPKVSTI